MKEIFFYAVLIFFTSSCLAQSNSLQYYLNEAREARKISDNKKFYDMVLEAHKLHPYHQGILYQAGIAAALNNKPEESINYLTRAIQIKADYDLNNPDLKSLENNSDFQKLKLLQTSLQKEIVQSDTAFLIKDRTLHIESIAKGESKNVFYLGSIHKRKIIRVDEKRSITDFTTEGQDGLCSVFGIKVDAPKNVLWACSSPTEEMEPGDSTTMSAVYKYDVQSGKFISKYTPAIKREYTFGDLTLDPSGNVFVSDSKNNIIFTLDQQKGILEEYFTSKEFWNLQGLTFSQDGRYLFIADYVKGIFRLDTKDKSLRAISHNLPISIKSVDGLSFYNNSLVVIQNLIFPMRVTQLMLNETAEAFKDYTIIDRAHPAFNEPTIGCIVNDTLFYVANSQWSGYDEHRRIKPATQLQDIAILKADLKTLNRQMR